MQNGKKIMGRMPRSRRRPLRQGPKRCGSSSTRPIEHGASSSRAPRQTSALYTILAKKKDTHRSGIIFEELIDAPRHFEGKELPGHRAFINSSGVKSFRPHRCSMSL